VDIAYEKLGVQAPRCTTDRVPLPGGTLGSHESFDAFAAHFRTASGLAPELADRLLRLYGARAPEVLAEAGEDHSLRLPLASPATVQTGLLGAEVLYAFRRELAETLSDVLLRRSMVGMGPKVALDVDRAAAEVAVDHLGWDGERAEREVAEYRDYVRRYKPKALQETGPLGV
jgi:glycerol-3-phosphate dehydrogenase